MKLLLDTHALLWFLAGSGQLSGAALTAINDPANERWLSPISLLEIAIKVRINKLRLTAPFGVLFPAQLTANRIGLWPLEAPHCAALTTLPLHHRDPFDRVLIAQALVAGLPLLSADAIFDQYGISRLW
ncbi:MAG TPA: type II toxin-antitoxin system VapC family toxin [Gemmataceae bacterium]|nr:type II toxin-antitoxin system VapC family toxin [Gemmataceae bacterium]